MQFPTIGMLSFTCWMETSSFLFLSFFLIIIPVFVCVCFLRVGSEDHNREVKPHEVAFLSQEDNQNIVRIFNDSDKVADFVLIAGEPTNEPVKQHGPMVMNTEEELIQAFRFSLFFLFPITHVLFYFIQ